jgi:hypothetical protein
VTDKTVPATAPEAADSQFPLPLPKFPLQRPRTECRIVVLKLTDENAEPPDEWIDRLAAEDVDDIVQMRPLRGESFNPGIVALRSNGDFAVRQSKHFADRLRAEAGDDLEAQIELAYRLALSREPSADEMTAMRTFRNEQPLEEMCRVIFNLNEFVNPD